MTDNTRVGLGWLFGFVAALIVGSRWLVLGGGTLLNDSASLRREIPMSQRIELDEHARLQALRR
jgi:hypothetical protein